MTNSRKISSFFDGDAAGRKRKRDEQSNEGPMGIARDEAAVTGGAASSQTICGLDSPGQSGSGKASGGAGSALAPQTICGFDSPGQMSSSCPKVSVCPDGKRLKLSLGSNQKWREISEDDQKIYLDFATLPEGFKPEVLSQYDISLAVNQRLTDAVKLVFLTQCWRPTKDYNFYPVHQGSNRYPQFNWLVLHNHLAFSHREHGFFCLVCVLFGKKEVGQGGHQARGYFCDRPFRKFKDFGEVWKGHANNIYHKESAITAENFERAMNSQATVKQAISSGYFPRSTRTGG
jgi:hypothetical protein